MSYGECESIVQPFTAVTDAGRAPAHRDGGARHHDGRRRRRHRLLRVRARRAGERADVVRRGAAGVLAGVVAVGARGGRDEPDAHRRELDRLDGARERDGLRGAVPATASGGGGPARSCRGLGGSPRSRSRPRASAWCPTSRLRGREPRLSDRLSQRRPGLQGLGPEHRFVGGTSAAAPSSRVRSGAWVSRRTIRACRGPGSSRRCSTTSRSTTRRRSLDVAQGTYALFGGSCCPTRPGFDLPPPAGLTAAGVIASSLVHLRPPVVADERLHGSTRKPQHPTRPLASLIVCSCAALARPGAARPRTRGPRRRRRARPLPRRRRPRRRTRRPLRSAARATTSRPRSRHLPRWQRDQGRRDLRRTRIHCTCRRSRTLSLSWLPSASSRLMPPRRSAQQLKDIVRQTISGLTKNRRPDAGQDRGRVARRACSCWSRSSAQDLDEVDPHGLREDGDSASRVSALARSPRMR